MQIIWLGYLFEIVILILIRPYVTNFPAIGLVAVLIHSFFTMVVLLGLKDKIKMIYLLAFVLRVLFLFWDLYARNVFVLPHSGADTEVFFENALIISNNLSTIESSNAYSSVMGVLFNLIGSQRIFGQYLNVLLGFSVILIIHKILKLLRIKEKITYIIIIIASFFPSSLIMSSIFLREMLPTFFVSLSLLYFIKWFKHPKLLNASFSLLFLGGASIFHSGIIGVSLGYFFGFLFYDVKSKKIKFSVKTVTYFFFIITAIILGFTVFEEMIFGKFQNVDNFSDLYSTANIRLGGAVYLETIKITNPIELLIFGPIKALYFLVSPMPWDWRGLIDIITFIMDSLLYMILIVYFVKNKKYLKDYKPLVLIVLWMLIGASFIFGIGVSNAGTAMRHRQKLIPIFLILYGVVKNQKYKFISKYQERNINDNSHEIKVI